jgi:F-type H+-transporting ATPase subunit b
VLFDWFTVAAQIFNFLVLVALLKHFLYDRVLAAMKEREKRVQERLEAADRKQKEADAEAEDYRRQQAELERRRKALLDEARQEADDRREKMVAEARREVDQRRQSWEDALAAEKEEFLRELRRRVAAEVYAACRKAMKDLADADLEQRVVDVFLERLADSDPKVRDTLRQAAADGDGRMAVRSSFELSGKGRQRVTQRLQRMVSEDVAVDYETDPDLLLGIEVEGQGRRVAWHVRDYFDTLHDRAAELFAEAGEMDVQEAQRDAPRE